VSFYYAPPTEDIKHVAIRPSVRLSVPYSVDQKRYVSSVQIVFLESSLLFLFVVTRGRVSIYAGHPSER